MAFLTMERLTQPVAAGGNRLACLSGHYGPVDLPLIAAGSIRGPREVSVVQRRLPT